MIVAACCNFYYGTGLVLIYVDDGKSASVVCTVMWLESRAGDKFFGSIFDQIACATLKENIDKMILITSCSIIVDEKSPIST